MARERGLAGEPRRGGPTIRRLLALTLPLVLLVLWGGRARSEGARAALERLLAAPQWGASERSEARRLLDHVSVRDGADRALVHRVRVRLAVPPRGSGTDVHLAADHWRNLAVVERVKSWSYPNYTRVVVYLDRAIRYEVHTLPADPPHDKPPRIYLDLHGARLDPRIEHELPIGDGLLKRARIAQFDRQRARLVLDLESLAAYHVVPFRKPFRIVVDVRGERPRSRSRTHRERHRDEDGVAAILGGRAPRDRPPPEIRKPRRPTIVVDAGHGGKDPGAIGYRGLQEKKLTLAVAKKVARLLRRKGYRVVLTRDDDRYLTLEERTIVANRENADLFVSIHANSAPDRRAYGVETYHLAPPSDRRAAQVAARENATGDEADEGLDELLAALKLSSRRSVSSALAQFVQRRIAERLARRYKPFRSIGVKGAPFYVLVGTDMAAVLVEIGFVTNPTEAQRLQSRRYQEELAQAIVEGIETYLARSSKIPI